ncbi:MAG: hypothetical protein R3B93_22080 [Bacteroidia bacterium]
MTEAAIAFEKAIDINPNYETTYLWYAFALRRLTYDYEKALTILEKALRLNPLSPAIIQNMGNLYSLRGEFDQALIVYKKGISIEPRNSFFWEGISSDFYQQGQIDSSAIYAYKGILINGFHQRFLNNYLQCLNYLGLISEMKTLLRDLKPQNNLDSLIMVTQLREVAIFEKDFEWTLRLTDQMKDFGNSQNELSSIRRYYSSLDEFILHIYNRDYYRAVEIFENHYPNINKVEQNNFNAMVFPEYIFSLEKLGQHEKANQLWENYRPYFPKNDFFEARNALLVERPEVAHGKFKKFLEGNTTPPLQYFENNPMFDEVRSQPGFQELIKDYQKKIKKYRDSFLNYKEKNL